MLRSFLYGVLSCLLWLDHLDATREFESWSSVYYFCGENYQFCSSGFRWNMQ